MKKYIPIYQPEIGISEKKFVNDCLNSTWISSKGSYIEKFESAIGKFTGSKYVSCVSNGTVALHLALLALKIGREDEVILPNLTYIATANSIKYVGATPVFVDVDQNTWQIDITALERKINVKTKAIMVVHLYGYPTNMRSVMTIARKYNLRVIEDCAEAFGTKYLNKHVGTFGDIGTFSFYGNKTITTGEGGAVIAKNKKIFKLLNKLKGQGLANNKRYWHDVIGYNYRMTNICAAIGLGQINRIKDILNSKREIYNQYKVEFSKRKDIIFPEESKYGLNSYWMISIRLLKVGIRDKLIRYLDKNMIETRPVFYPVTMMKMYSENSQNYPNTYKIGLNSLNLPSWPGISKKEVKHIAHTIMNYLDKNIYDN